MTDEYQYHGLALTPGIIQDLIMQLCNGGELKRNQIANKVLEFHISEGGKSTEAQDYSRSVKKALSELQKKGIAKNRAYGIWSIIVNGQKAIQEPVDFEQEEIEDDKHKTYGKGEFAVYLYFYNSYRELSCNAGKNRWQCKIGRTDRDPLTRVLSQASTAMPEKPNIEFVIKTDNSSLLEAMLHSILKLRGHHIKDSPGSEWFNTNPEEVLEIVNWVSPNILEP